MISPLPVAPHCGATLRLEPGPRGYRYNLDAFLLAEFADLPGQTLVADLGTGSGVVGVLLALRYPQLRVVGIDLQWDLLRLAADNARNSGLAGRFKGVRADLRQTRAWARPGRFHAAVINPPYRKVGAGRLSPDPARAMARHEVTLDLPAWLEAARHLIAPGGRLFVTHLAEREDEVVRRMGEKGFVLWKIRRVHPFEGTPPSTVLLEARREGVNPGNSSERRSSLGPGNSPQEVPPLIVYREPGLYTEEIRGMYKGFELEMLGG